MDCEKQSQEKAMDTLLYNMGEVAFTNYLYKRQVLCDQGIQFDEDTKFGEDREFNWKYLANCNTAAFVNEPLYWYRVNEASATKSKATWRKTDLLKAVKRIEDYLSDHQCGYTDSFKSYMYARSMWAVAKTFALSKDKALFQRLRKEYDIRKCMLRTARDKSKAVAIASCFYLIHPWLFFYAVSLKR